VSVGQLNGFSVLALGVAMVFALLAMVAALLAARDTRPLAG
jgi:Na+-transporting methylmalonyl-CoA/oxaloacetate decarboxylase gamma subunit